MWSHYLLLLKDKYNRKKLMAIGRKCAWNNIIGPLIELLTTRISFSSKKIGALQKPVKCLDKFWQYFAFILPALSEIYRTHLDPRIGFCIPAILGGFL